MAPITGDVLRQMTQKAAQDRELATKETTSKQVAQIAYNAPAIFEHTLRECILLAEQEARKEKNSAKLRSHYVTQVERDAHTPIFEKVATALNGLGISASVESYYDIDGGTDSGTDFLAITMQW